MGTGSASSVPPMWCWSPYGRTMTSPSLAQCLSPSPTRTQQAPAATTWKRITRSVPGRSTAAVSSAVKDSYSHGS